MEMTNPQKAERYIQNLRKVQALSKPQFSLETALAARFQDEGFCERLAQKLDQERKKVYLQVYHVGEEQ